MRNRRGGLEHKGIGWKKVLSNTGRKFRVTEVAKLLYYLPKCFVLLLRNTLNT